MSRLYISNLCSDIKNQKKFLNIVSKFQDINGLDIAPLNVSKDWENSENNSKKFKRTRLSISSCWSRSINKA